MDPGVIARRPLRQLMVTPYALPDHTSWTANQAKILPVSDGAFKRFVDERVDQLGEAILEAKAPGRKK